MSEIATLSQKFYKTFYQKHWPGELSPSIANISVEDAYRVQDLVAQKRMERGETVVGYKVGCTSAAIRTQFGLDEPISGRLFAPHIYTDDVKLDWRDYVNCAIEPEMVIRIGRDLRMTDPTDADLLDAIEYVSPGIEVHHFKFWHSPPTSQELISSGGIHAGQVIGATKVSPHKLSFQDEDFRVYANGALVAEAPASEIMGGPLHSLRWLVNSLARRNMVLKAGSWVIPGSPTELIPIQEDTDLRVEIDKVGSIVANFRSN